MKERYLLVLVRGIGYTVCRRSQERISESRRWGRRSWKQQKNSFCSKLASVMLYTVGCRPAGIRLQSAEVHREGCQFSLGSTIRRLALSALA